MRKLIAILVTLITIFSVNAATTQAHAANVIWSAEYGYTLDGVHYVHYDVYSNQNPSWQVGSFNAGAELIFQSDRNLVSYCHSTNYVWLACWASNTNGIPAIGHWALQSDGNLVIYNGYGGVSWATNKYRPYINASQWEADFLSNGCLYQWGYTNAWHVFWKSASYC